jgi:MFS family permease
VATRIASQVGDGLFQLAAADLLLFERPGANPALELTALLAVTLVPFSAVVPLVGVLIDRWDRRRILAYTPLVRAALAALLPLAAPGGREGPAFYAIALLVLSANRLFLATIAAVLPQLVPARDLLVANSVAATGGSVATLAGLGLGGLVAALAGGTSVALVAASAFAVAAALARTLPVRRAARARPAPFGRALAEVAREMLEGIRRVRERPPVRFALTAVGAGQTLVGLVTGATAVLFIAHLRLGVGSVSTVLAATGLGLGVGVVVVPVVARRVREEALVAASFAIGAAGVLAAATDLTRPRMLAGAVVIGLSYAFAKIPVDTIVQRTMPDAFRGRAFAVYDFLFNVARVTGTGVAAAAVAASLGLRTIVLAAGLAYLATSAGLATWARRIVGVGALPPRRARRPEPAGASEPSARAPAPPFRPGEVIAVRAYAGSRADEEPRALVLGGAEVPVEEVLWRGVVEREGERRRVFVVRAAGARLRLAYVESTSLWEVERVLPGGPAA